MKAIRVHAFGGNDAMVFEDVPDPVADEGEYVVRIRAAGVNPVDWKIVRGYLSKGFPHALPFVPGWDLSGEVIARGHGARRFEVGAKVYGYVRRPSIDRGTYAEQQAVPECYLAAMPTTASFEVAASLPLVTLTSLQALENAGLAAGHRALILGASGGTGSAAIQLARILGADVAGVASAKNHEFVRSLGASEVYDYAGATPDGIVGVPAGSFDVIYDCIGGDTLRAARPALREGGHAVSITTRAAPGWEDLGARFHYTFVEPNAAQLADIARWFDEAKLSTHIDATFTLDRASEAHALSEKAHTRGKIVLTMG